MYIIDSSLSRHFSSGVGNISLVNRRIANKADVKQAAYDVYGASSIIARRMRGRPKITNVTIKQILDYISDRIYKYFNEEPNTENTEKNFDIFHHELCEYFKTQYNSKFVSSETDAIEYGIAQKLINMIFKYLSCYSDYTAFSGLFIYCHMPIDSYILYYFYIHHTIPGCRGYFPPSATSPYAQYRSAPKNKWKTWSNLAYDDYINLLNDYRTALSIVYPDYSMLHLEYYIWSKIQSRLDSEIEPIPTTAITKIPGFFM